MYNNYGGGQQNNGVLFSLFPNQYPPKPGKPPVVAQGSLDINKFEQDIMRLIQNARAQGADKIAYTVTMASRPPASHLLIMRPKTSRNAGGGGYNGSYQQPQYGQPQQGYNGPPVQGWGQPQQAQQPQPQQYPQGTTGYGSPAGPSVQGNTPATSHTPWQTGRQQPQQVSQQAPQATPWPQSGQGSQQDPQPQPTQSQAEQTPQGGQVGQS